MARGNLVEHLEGIEYPADWDERKRRVKARDNYTCQRCGRQNLQLHVHHENGRSDDLSNLVTLCKECHYDEHPFMRTAAEARSYKDEPLLIMPKPSREEIALRTSRIWDVVRLCWRAFHLD